MSDILEELKTRGYKMDKSAPAKSQPSEPSSARQETHFSLPPAPRCMRCGGAHFNLGYWFMHPEEAPSNWIDRYPTPESRKIGLRSSQRRHAGDNVNDGRIPEYSMAMVGHVKDHG
ncbi:hypothetical protein MMC07_002548, partial [Pseudocyphellaria aurata]|nr:hypothetical protein [Pseudocyphellaria aurata]